MSRSGSFLCLAILTTHLCLGGSLPARAEALKLNSEYSVSLIGFPVAYAKFVTEIDGNAYSIHGSVRSSALADVLSKTRGTASVSGRFGEDRLLASRFTVSYSSGKHTHRTEIEFRNGNVHSAKNVPARRKSSPDWVPLKAEDMRRVLDPLSGMVFPASSGVCPRSLPIFDGQSRVTLDLRPKGVRPFRTNGFAGDAVVCSLRFAPKAGYRKYSSGIKYLSALTSIEVWFAKHERGGFYAPVYAKVPTKIGQVIVAATRFGS